MNLKLTAALLALLLSVRSAAQQQGLKFISYNQIGYIQASAESAWLLQTVNGVQYRTFSAGIGLGYDSYFRHSFPLFFDLRKNIFNRKETPFLYADLGLNFPQDRLDETEWETRRYSKGLYYDLGVGYVWAMKGKTNFMVSAGYSQKHVKESRTVEWNPTIIGPEKYHYTLRRLALKIGLGF